MRRDAAGQSEGGGDAPKPERRHPAHDTVERSVAALPGYLLDRSAWAALVCHSAAKRGVAPDRIAAGAVAFCAGWAADRAPNPAEAVDFIVKFSKPKADQELDGMLAELRQRQFAAAEAARLERTARQIAALFERDARWAEECAARSGEAVAVAAVRRRDAVAAAARNAAATKAALVAQVEKIRAHPGGAQALAALPAPIKRGSI